MGEALLSRAASALMSGECSGSSGLKTEIITKNLKWTVPKAKNQSFDIRLFGAGGGGEFMYTGNLNAGDVGYTSYSYGGGGCGGYMANGTFKLNEGIIITITIGKGSKKGNGGITSFGSYLSAAGGEGASETGGNGGSGGGLGNGIQFGGGGCCGSTGITKGGYGGTWGGGGGVIDNSKFRTGGEFGGNGGRIYSNNFSTGVNAENGTNTIGIISDQNLCGYGIGGGIAGGGGGYGGNGGISIYTNNNKCGTGGGGGYGADGGNAHGNAAAGGGGYGKYGKGGDGYEKTLFIVENEKSGSGNYKTFKICGGGGGYGPGGDYYTFPGYGGGGCNLHYYDNDRGKTGGPGICIIQYYSI